MDPMKPRNMFPRSVAWPIFLLVLAASATVFAQDRERIPRRDEFAPVRIAVDAAYPPYMFADEAGEARGLYPRIIAAAFRRMDVPLEIQALPWRRALRDGTLGETGIGGIYLNPERRAVFDYSAAIAPEILRIYVRPQAPFPFAELADLSGKTVGINRGWSYGEDFDRAAAAGIFRAEEAGDILANARKLIRGRIDCFIADEIAAARVLRRHGIAAAAVPLPTPVATSDGHLVFAKSTGRKALLERFDRTLETMRADGAYAAILREFLDAPDDGTLSPAP